MEENLKLKEELKSEINKELYDDLKNITQEVAGKVREEICVLLQFIFYIKKENKNLKRGKLLLPL